MTLGTVFTSSALTCLQLYVQFHVCFPDGCLTHDPLGWTTRWMPSVSSGWTGRSRVWSMQCQDPALPPVWSAGLVSWTSRPSPPPVCPLGILHILDNITWLTESRQLSFIIKSCYVNYGFFVFYAILVILITKICNEPYLKYTFNHVTVICLVWMFQGKYRVYIVCGMNRMLLFIQLRILLVFIYGHM